MVVRFEHSRLMHVILHLCFICPLSGFLRCVATNEAAVFLSFKNSQFTNSQHKTLLGSRSSTWSCGAGWGPSASIRCTLQVWPSVQRERHAHTAVFAHTLSCHAVSTQTNVKPINHQLVLTIFMAHVVRCNWAFRGRVAGGGCCCWDFRISDLRSWLDGGMVRVFVAEIYCCIELY